MTIMVFPFGCIVKELKTLGILSFGEVLMILKALSYKLYNSKYMIASTQLTSTKSFVFIAVQVIKLLSREVLFTNRKDNRNC